MQEIKAAMREQLRPEDLAQFAISADADFEGAVGGSAALKPGGIVAVKSADGKKRGGAAGGGAANGKQKGGSGSGKKQGRGGERGDGKQQRKKAKH